MYVFIGGRFPDRLAFGSLAVGGAGLVIVEATAVSTDGRISPADSGIYSDDHVEPFARISRFMELQGAVSGIQIAHAGRKASSKKSWEGGGHIDTSEGGWQTIAPSAIAFGAKLDKVPTAMTIDDLARVKGDFVAAAERSLAAGFQWLQVHFAHGYLAHEFYSPLSNKRTDQYGGSFDNRIRFMMETFEAVREVWPQRPSPPENQPKSNSKKVRSTNGIMNPGSDGASILTLKRVLSCGLPQEHTKPPERRPTRPPQISPGLPSK